MALTKILAGPLYYRVQTAAVVTTALNASDVIGTQEFFQAAVQVIHAGHTGSVTVYELQSSIDGIHYDTMPCGPYTTIGVSGSATIALQGVTGAFLRLKVTTANGVDPSPTLTVFFHGWRTGK